MQDQNQPTRRDVKLGPHGHKMGICVECNPDAGEKELIGHSLCRPHYDQQHNAKLKKAQKLTAGLALKAYSALLWVLHTLDASDRDIAQILQILRPYFQPIAKVIQPDGPCPFGKRA